MDYNEIIENVKVYGLDESVKRSKYPMAVDINAVNSDIVPRTLSLAQSDRGSGHDQFLTGIIVQFDLTFTVKAWTEAERYHFFDFVSSQSTMHRVTKFDLDKAYIEYVDPRIIEIIKEKVVEYNEIQECSKYWTTDRMTEQEIIKAKEDLKEKYLRILYSNPCGMKLTAGMTTNYRQLKTIYAQRKNHRLPEWRAFCAWIETLPHAQEFIIN